MQARRGGSHAALGEGLVFLCRSGLQRLERSLGPCQLRLGGLHCAFGGRDLARGDLSLGLGRGNLGPGNR